MTENSAPRPRTVLLTGALGNIGRILREPLAARYGGLRSTDLRAPGALVTGEQFIEGTLADPQFARSVTQGVDTVVHMAGTSEEDDWAPVLANNVSSVVNLFEAVRHNGVRRMVFASSHHVIGYHRRGRRLGAGAEPRPDSRYAVSKVFGEALGRLFADKYGLEVVCLRIGSFRPVPTTRRMLHIWIGPDDMVRLTVAAIDAPQVHFSVVYGVSHTEAGWWEMEDAEALGYRPVLDVGKYANDVENKAPPEGLVESLFQGGQNCEAEFAGVTGRIE